MNWFVVIAPVRSLAYCTDQYSTDFDDFVDFLECCEEGR